MKAASAVPDMPKNVSLAVIVVLALLIGLLPVLPPALSVVAGAAVAFVVAVFWPMHLVCFAIFVLPFAPKLKSATPLPDLSSILRVVAFLGIGYAAILRGEWPFLRALRHPVNLASMGFALFLAVTTLVLNSPSKWSFPALFYQFSFLCFFLVVAEVVDNKKALRAFLISLFCSTLVLSLFGFVQAVANDYTGFYFAIYPNQLAELAPWDGRITSFLNYSNSLAGYLNLVLPFSIAALLLPAGKGLRLLSAAVLLLGAVALYLTGSRGGYVAFGFTLMLAAVYLLRLRFAARFLLAAGAVALAGVLAFVRVNVGAIEDDPSAIARLVIFAAAWQMFTQSPVIGIGYGNFKGTFDASVLNVKEGTFDIHNLYLQYATEAGVIGLLLFLWMAAIVFRYARRLLQHPAAEDDRLVAFAVLAGTASILLHGLVDFLFIVSPPTGTLFWGVLGLLAAGTAAAPAWRSPRA